jgi:protease-4
MVLVVVPIIVLFCFGLAASSLVSDVEPKFEGVNRVAVVELSGVILDSKDIVNSLYAQAGDESVTGIVLRINSPGGAVGPSQEIYSVVRDITKKKPVVAVMTGVAASGGLYSALSASKIFCQPGTLTGSIGVIMQLPNVSKIADLVGFQMMTVKSGDLKDVGNAFRPMSATEQEYLQITINAAHKQFVEAISESRKIPFDTVSKFADGRVILGSQAVELGLVDGIGDTYSAAREIFNMAKIPLGADETPTIFYPEDKLGWLKDVMKSATTISQKMRGEVEFQYILR